MAPSQPYVITLRLHDSLELFQAPELNPFTGQATALSGIERIVGELKPRSAGQAVQATIHLPPARLAPGLEQACRDAVRIYCEAKIHQTRQDLASLRWQGIK